MTIAIFPQWSRALAVLRRNRVLCRGRLRRLPQIGPGERAAQKLQKPKLLPYSGATDQLLNEYCDTPHSGRTPHMLFASHDSPPEPGAGISNFRSRSARNPGVG